MSNDIHMEWTPGWTPLEYALRYARSGHLVLAVYPTIGGVCMCPGGCTKPGKHPIGGFHRATTRRSVLRSMFQGSADAGIGIQAPEGCVIVDVDPRNGGNKTFEQLAADRKVPRTPIQRSGGGGMHFVFRGEWPWSKTALKPGIEVITPGKGFVVAEPTIHVSGKRYQWLFAPWECEPAPLPQWLRPPDPSPPKSRERRTWSFENMPQRFDAEYVQRTWLDYIKPDDEQTWREVAMVLRSKYGDAAWPLFDQWSQTTKKDNYHAEENWKRWESFAQPE